MSENSWDSNNTSAWGTPGYAPGYAPAAEPSETPAEAMESRQGFEVAATDFRRNVNEASDRLSSAAETFISMAEGLSSAVDDARKAADEAREAKAAAEAVKARMEADYGAVSDMVRDLQERIAALAILARPMSSVAVPAVEDAAPEDTPEVSAGYSEWSEQSQQVA